MQLPLALLLIFASSPVVGAIPQVSQTFCANMTDSLYETPVVHPIRKQLSSLHYTLCLDRSRMMYKKIDSCHIVHEGSRVIKPCGDFTNRHIISIHKNNKMYIIKPTDNTTGINCTVNKDVSDNETIPFNFVVIDSDANDQGRGNATFVNTTTIDGKTVELWSHIRGGVHGTMFWWVTKADSAGVSDMVRTTCLNHAGNAGNLINTEGDRDYHSGYSREVPADAFHLPLACYIEEDLLVI
eukprot:gnl/TRDRNA2_/TRDRNA2_30158_c0_seq2.p1 gnl/TRDRNA2_/TRDRNA2_30158_c0~~gnl/TRDRNA2_/TRDRNA2_30158_c0_seq2.p1  ORF type:complete len:240 (-),score=20.14 gnl/TRDRNA2_/TRDRNA2_30158_c0_seq2:70-789(-)